MKSTDMDVLVRYYEVFNAPASPPLDIVHLDLPLPELFALAQKALDENTPNRLDRALWPSARWRGLLKERFFYFRDHHGFCATIEKAAQYGQREGEPVGHSDLRRLR